MSDKYVITVRQLSSGKWRATVSCDESLYDHGSMLGRYRDYDELWNDEKTFDKAAEWATERAAHYVALDVLAKLRDSYESNTPIAQASC